MDVPHLCILFSLFVASLFFPRVPLQYYLLSLGFLSMYPLPYICPLITTYSMLIIADKSRTLFCWLRFACYWNDYYWFMMDTFLISFVMSNFRLLALKEKGWHIFCYSLHIPNTATICLVRMVLDISNLVTPLNLGSLMMKHLVLVFLFQVKLFVHRHGKIITLPCLPR